MSILGDDYSNLLIRRDDRRMTNTLRECGVTRRRKASCMTRARTKSRKNITIIKRERPCFADCVDQFEELKRLAIPGPASIVNIYRGWGPFL